MADVPKVFTLSGVTSDTDFGTVPANKVWIIKSALVYGTTSTTDAMALSIGGDLISGEITFLTGADRSIDLLLQAGSGEDNEHARTVIAEAAEAVRLVFGTGSGSKNARLSVIEVDV